MAEIAVSITTSGLRMPIEVWKPSQPTEQHRYGLISGLRRLTAHQRLAASRQNGSFTEIAAFLRTPETIPQAMADMVAENEIPAETSPWEKGATRPAHGAGVLRGKGQLDLCLPLITPGRREMRHRGSRAPISQSQSCCPTPLAQRPPAL